MLTEFGGRLMLTVADGGRGGKNGKELAHVIICERSLKNMQHSDEFILYILSMLVYWHTP